MSLALARLARWRSSKALPLVQTLVHRLTIRHLRLIVAIAEQNSLVAAAQHLHMTQSAVTKALQEAEALLGITLFERTIKGAIPTIFAHGLIVHARQVFAQLQQASTELVELLDGANGRVAIGTQWSAAAELVPKAIHQLRSTRPKLTVSIVEGTNDALIPELHLGQLDMIVGRLPGMLERDDVAHETLFEDMACVVVRHGHPLADWPDIGLADVEKSDWILPRRETVLRRQIDKAFRDAGLETPGNAIESVSLLTNSELLTSSDYLAVWPWQVANRDVLSGRLMVLPIVIGETINSVGVTARTDAPMAPAAKAFLETLRSVAATMDVCPLLPGIREGNSSGN